MSARWFFKCQGLGHIASDCPNQKAIMAEWETIKEEKEDVEEETVLEEETSPEEEVTGS